MKNVKKIGWMICEQIIRNGLNLITTIVLTAFIAPDEFSIIAIIVSVLTVFGALSDFGIQQALIRLKIFNTEIASTAYWFVNSFAIFLYVQLILFLPLIGRLFDVELDRLLFAFGATILIFNAQRSVLVAILNRHMNFQALMKINVAATFISGVTSLILCLISPSIWVLVSQMVLTSLFTTILIFLKVSWRPKRTFIYPQIVKVTAVGSKLFLSNFLDIVFKGLFVLVISRNYSAEILGFYFLADKFRDVLVLQTMNSLQSVLFPVLSKLWNHQDIDTYGRALERMSNRLNLLIIPSLTLISFCVWHLSDIIVASSWIEAAKLFSLMLLASSFIPCHVAMVLAFKSSARADYLFYLEVIKKVIGTVLLLLTYNHGLYAIIFGQLTSSVLALPIAIYLAGLICKRNLIQLFVKPVFILLGTLLLLSMLSFF